MKCQNCGAELAAGVSFCRECGAKVTQQKRFCRECGSELAENAKFCANCGAKTEVHVEAGSSVATATSEPTHGAVTEKLTRGVANAIPDLNQAVSGLSAKAKALKVIPAKKTVIIAAISILLLLALVLGGKGLSSTSGANAPNEGNRLEMVNVTNMAYPDAFKTLLDIGFSNVVSNITSDTDESLWIVTGQSVDAGKTARPQDEIALTCAMKCKLYLDITSETNLFFSTYDITITLDGTEIGSVANGKEFTYLADILTGDHELVFCKSGDTSPRGTKKISISGDMTYSCTLSHDSSSVSIKDEHTESNVSSSALEVPDVTGMILSDAISNLESSGFSNIKEEPYEKIWNRGNWIVTKQGVTAGTTADKNEFIQLDCMSLDDYFSESYVGKNAAEIQKLAEKSGFSIRFEDSSGKNLNDTVSGLSDDEKKDWVATAARTYGGAKRTAVVEIRSNKTVPETPEENPADTEKNPSVILPEPNTKLGKDFDDEMDSADTVYYINVDGVSNQPTLKEWGTATVTDGVAEYLDSLESQGCTVRITDSETKTPSAGFTTYEIYFEVTNQTITWDMYLYIQDENYVEYELDINLP